MKIYLTVLCPCNKIQDGSKILVDQYIGISHHKNQYRLATSPKHHWSPLTRLTVWTRRIKNKKNLIQNQNLANLVTKASKCTVSLLLSLSVNPCTPIHHCYLVTVLIQHDFPPPVLSIQPEDIFKSILTCTFSHSS